jgi:hypothetical protein
MVWYHSFGLLVCCKHNVPEKNVDEMKKEEHSSSKNEIETTNSLLPFHSNSSNITDFGLIVDFCGRTLSSRRSSSEAARCCCIEK